MGQTFLRKTVDGEMVRMSRRISDLEKKTISNKQVFITVGEEKNKDNNFDDIQEAIDYVYGQGGGTVFIKNGEYLVNNNIVMKQGVSLLGESPYNVVINFQGQAYQIQSKGTSIYSTGTITLTNRSNIITGSGTNWTSAYEGKAIIYKGYLAYIVSVNSTTEMEVDLVWMKETEASVTFNIVNELIATNISNITVVDSTHSDGGIFYQYSYALELAELIVFSSTIGIKFNSTTAVNIEGWETYSCGTGIKIENCGGGWSLSDGYLVDSTNNGLDVDGLSDCSLTNFSILTSGSDGMSFNNIRGLGISDFSLLSNGANGIHFQSNCSNTEVLNANIHLSTNDGIKLDSNIDSIIVTATTIKTNSGYGVNIANANCDKNIICNNTILSNVSGSINNSGTSTITANNQT